MSGDNLILAYMAGIVDADGHISIHRREHQTKAGRKVYYSPLIGIAGTDRKPHDLAKNLWGGSLFTYQPKNTRHKLQFQWQSIGIRAATAIEAILPFLRIKEEQAFVALELWKHVEDGRATAGNPYPWFSDSFDPTRRSAELKEEIARLNGWRRKQMTGKTPIPEDLQIRQFPRVV